MSTTVRCRRCGEEKPALERAPLPGATGQEVFSSICQSCWQEWAQAEVMVINELQLNFLDPGAPKILEDHMREFLALGESHESGSA